MHKRRILAPRHLAIAAGALLVAGIAAGIDGPAAAAEAVVMAPAAKVDAPSKGGRETAVFAGGCFWGVDGVFSHVKGVIHVDSGYAGGDPARKVTYDDVSTGSTGYAEAVRVTYDPRVVSYGQLLRIFFSVATNPTQLNYQGPDHGTQYRNALFPINAAQDKAARAYLAQLGAARVWPGKIVTRIERFTGFQTAEGYHQDFLERNPAHPYIKMWDAPKLAALRKLFPAVYNPRAAG